MAREQLFGYRHVQGVPLCPCRDPGNYMAAERDTDAPLVVTFRCWCGATLRATYDSSAELSEFLSRNGLTAADGPT